MFVLDTNVVSELRKVRLGKADARVASWAESIDAADLYLSVITVQELEIGVLLAERRDPAQGAVFRVWLDSHSCRHLPAASCLSIWPLRSVAQSPMFPILGRPETD